MNKKRSFKTKGTGIKPGRKKSGIKQSARFDKPGSVKSKPADKIRLNKFIANTGLCSRREADIYIQKGLISVNGIKVLELGTKVSIRDEVKLRGEKLLPEKKVYILMNKPKDVITTTDDPQGRKTVFSLIKTKMNERIYPVGRLDRISTGVLLLTNDGDLTKKLTHPKFNKKKIYQVELNRELYKKDLEQIKSGIMLDDGPINADAISYIDLEEKRNIGIEIHSGRNRILRRIFEHLGYKVIKLDRVYFAGLTKKGLPRGKWRYLTDKEISILKRGSYN